MGPLTIAEGLERRTFYAYETSEQLGGGGTGVSDVVVAVVEPVETGRLGNGLRLRVGSRGSDWWAETIHRAG